MRVVDVDMAISSPVENNLQVSTPLANQVIRISAAKSLPSKDADALKLFIGQIPKHFEEKEIRPIFEKFGEIYEIVILKDRATGVSRGCAFCTYCRRESALAAQRDLHEKKILPGMHFPLQVKPADSETRPDGGLGPVEERKLFIGMLSKNVKEDDLRDMFLPFGSIEELTILRNPDGTSKGCSFLKFTTRQAALSAINAMHNSRIMEGASSPLVVKFADTEKDKMMRRMNQVGMGLVYGFPINGALTQYAMYQQDSLQVLQQQMMLQAGVMTAQPNEGALVQSQGQNPQSLFNAGINPMALSLNPQLAAYNAIQASRVPQKEGLVEQSQQWACTSPGPSGGALVPVSQPPSPPSQCATQPAPPAPPHVSAASTPALSIASQQQQQQQQQSAITSHTQALLAPSSQYMTIPQPSLSDYAAAAQYKSGLLENPYAPSKAVSLGLGNGSYLTGNPLMGMTAQSLGGPLGGPGGLGQQYAMCPSSMASLAGMPGMNPLHQSLMSPASLGMSGMTSASLGMSPASLGGMPGMQMSHASLAGMSPASLGLSGMSGMSPASSLGLSRLGAMGLPMASGLRTPRTANLRGTESGPEGANLFIYHLPQEFTDTDLVQTFSPFGNVISAKVFVDKVTNLSKCFGFVSYDNAISAQAAIQAMNGFQIGMKRLKVQLKRAKDTNKPY